MLKNLVKRLYRFLLYCTAATILLSAIVVTLARLMLPYVDRYHDEIQVLVNQYTEHPVTISKIEAEWDSWLPVFSLYDVVIFETDTSEPMVALDSMVVKIDILKSVYSKEITLASIVVPKLDLTLQKLPGRGADLFNKVTSTLTTQGFSNETLIKWLRHQGPMTIGQARLVLLDSSGDNDALLSLLVSSLSMQNTDDASRFTGTVGVSGSEEEKLYFVLDVNRHTTLSVEGTNINVATVLEQMNASHLNVYKGVGDFNLHSSWGDGAVSKVDGQFKLQPLILKNGSSTLQVNNLAGKFSAIRDGDHNMTLSVDVEKLVTANSIWPKSRVSVKQLYAAPVDSYGYEVSADYLDLGDVNAFLQLYPVLSKPFAFMDALSVKGVLTDSTVKYDPTLAAHERLYFASGFSDLQLEHVEYAFSSKNLSGFIDGTKTQGKLVVDAIDAQFELAHIFSIPLSLYELNGELDWQFANDHWSIWSQALNAHSADLDLALSGEMQFSADLDMPFADLSVELSNAKVNELMDYLPVQTPKKLQQWLKDALVAGEVPVAEFVLKGALADYPFYNNEGTFKGFAEVQQGTLRYSRKWPAIKAINARIDVNGDTLTINADAGIVSDAQIVKASAVIKNITNQTVKRIVATDFHINGDIANGLRFIEDSPLRDQPSLELLSSSNFSGGLDLSLNLQIPLPFKPPAINGDLSITDGSIDVNHLQTTLTEMNGVVNFTRSSTSALNIKAHYFGYPVDIDFDKQVGAATKITVRGSADPQFIESQLGHHVPVFKSLHRKLAEHTNGSALWQLSGTENMDAELAFVIESALEGLSVDLPAPLTKDSTSLPMTLSIKKIEQNTRSIGIQYGDLLHGKIDIVSAPIDNANSGSSSLATNHAIQQVMVTAAMQYLAVDEWLSFILGRTTSDATQTTAWPITVDLQVGVMEFLNQCFADVAIKLRNTEAGYHLSLSSEAIKGDLYIAHSTDEQPLIVKLQTLKLAKIVRSSEDQEVATPINLNNMPAFEISIEELIYDDLQFGHLHIRSNKIDGALRLEPITLSNNNVIINGHGIWHIADDHQQTSVFLTLNADSMASILETFNYAEGAIHSKDVELVLDATWAGDPTNFSLSRMNGKLAVQIADIQLDNVDPSIMKLLGILSLKSLPQRLVLDFSDLFSKGTTFHKISGEFAIDGGNAYANDVWLSGHSLDIKIVGRAGLIARDYDQQVTVIPKVSDSLPLIGASLFASTTVLGVGAMMLLVNNILNKSPNTVDKLLLKEYQISGSWDDPEITEIKLRRPPQTSKQNEDE